jgi:hypothetical protein
VAGAPEPPGAHEPREPTADDDDGGHG